MKILISILIPVRNDLKNLRRCLFALSKQLDHECQVLVCDDGSHPPVSDRELNDIDWDLNLLRTPGLGPASARNLMASKAEGEYLFFMDADTAVLPGTIDKAKQIISYHPELQAFIGSYDDEPNSQSLVSLYENLTHHFVHQNSGGKIQTFWCGCGVIKRRTYLRFGGLDERFSDPSIEDIELGMRLSARGIEIRLFPELQVKHNKHWSGGLWLRTELFQRGIPWVRLMLSRNQWVSQLNFSYRQRLSALTAVLIVPAFLLIPVFPKSAVIFLLLVFGFVVLNLPLFYWLAKQQGLWRVGGMVILHWIYSWIAVISFVSGIFLGLFFGSGLKRSAERSTVLGEIKGEKIGD